MIQKYQATKFDRGEVLKYIKDNFDKIAEPLGDGKGHAAVLSEKSGRGLVRIKGEDSIRSATIEMEDEGKGLVFRGTELEKCEDGVLKIFQKDIERIIEGDVEGDKKPFLPLLDEPAEDQDNPFLPKVDEID